MILRLSWAEPTVQRGAWLERNPYSLITLPRHKFRKDKKGTDSVTSAWFLWDKHLALVNDTVTREERDSLKRFEL